MSEPLIVTFKPYIDAAFITAREGDLKQVRYFISLPFDPEMVDDEDRTKLGQLSKFVGRAEEVERVHGHGALLDLDADRIVRLVSKGKISDHELINARAFRASGNMIAPASLLEDRTSI